MHDRFNTIIKRFPRTILALAGVVIGLMTLYFGIRFKGYQMENHAQWLPSGGGLYFTKNSIAHTNDFFITGSGKGPAAGSVSIVMALQAEDLNNANFRYVLCVNNGDDTKQLLLGQWRQWLVIMNGNDYDGKRGTPKAYIDIGDTQNKQILLSISSDGDGTVVYVDGQAVKAQSGLHLYYPGQQEAKPGRLVIANSMHGNHPWHGILFGLALYDTTLSEQQVGFQYRRWAEDRDFNAAILNKQPPKPRVCYIFEPNQMAGKIHNKADEAIALKIPKATTVLKKAFLHWPSVPRGTEWNLIKDVVVNILGFIPLGAILSILYTRFRGARGRRGWLFAMGLAFVFSLSMEIIQAWIPSRDSSLLDLLLNTLGAGVGAGLIYHFLNSVRLQNILSEKPD